MTNSATPSQTIGPFFSFSLNWLQTTDLVEPWRADAVRLAGTVYDGNGTVVPDAIVEIWQSDPQGHFPPDAAPGWSGFGRCLVDQIGNFAFTTVKPGCVALANGETQAPHIDVVVFCRGLLRSVSTRIYFPDEVDANSSDPVLSAVPESRRSTLLATQSDEGLCFNIHLQGADETVFFAT